MGAPCGRRITPVLPSVRKLARGLAVVRLSGAGGIKAPPDPCVWMLDDTLSLHEVNKHHSNPRGKAGFSGQVLGAVEKERFDTTNET